jgi:hypothetical protein
MWVGLSLLEEVVGKQCNLLGSKHRALQVGSLWSFIVGGFLSKEATGFSYLWLMNLTMAGSIPYLGSLSIRRWRGTASKARARSRKTR